MATRLIDPTQQARRHVDRRSGLVPQREQRRDLDRLKRSLPVPKPDDPTVVWVPEGHNIANALAANPGRHLKLAAATYRLFESISVPTGTTVEGAGIGQTLILLPDQADFPAFDLDAVSDATVRGLSITHEGEYAAGHPDHAAPGYTGAGIGVRTRGDATDILVEDVEVDLMYVGFFTQGETGTTPGTVRRIVYRRCRGTRSNTFGFCHSEADVVEQVECVGTWNRLDGGKIQRQTRNVTVRGGEYSDNGQSYVDGGGNAGDGIDAFAGGRHFSIEGGAYERNNGNGLTIKTDITQVAGAATYGYTADIQVIGPRCNDNLLGYGCAIFTYTNNDYDSTGNALIPDTQYATVLGGEYSGNAYVGLLLNGVAHNAVSPIVRRNGDHGIVVGARSLYCSITTPLVAASGQDGSGTKSGIYIAGAAHTSIRGGTILGVDDDLIRNEADLAALTPTHFSNVYVSGFSTDVHIDLDFEDYSTSDGIHTDQTTGVCLTRQRGTLSPNTDFIYGSIGSRYHKTDASDPINRDWIKTSGAPNAVGGWTREAAGIVVTALPAASATYRSAIVSFQGGGGVADALYQCQKSAGGTYSWVAL